MITKTTESSSTCGYSRHSPFQNITKNNLETRWNNRHAGASELETEFSFPRNSVAAPLHVSWSREEEERGRFRIL